MEKIITMNIVRMFLKYQFIILYQGEVYLLGYSLLNTTMCKIVMRQTSSPLPLAPATSPHTHKHTHNLVTAHNLAKIYELC